MTEQPRLVADQPSRMHPDVLALPGAAGARRLGGAGGSSGGRQGQGLGRALVPGAIRLQIDGRSRRGA